jgi:hypothetical protein
VESHGDRFSKDAQADAIIVVQRVKLMEFGQQMQAILGAYLSTEVKMK